MTSLFPIVPVPLTLSPRGTTCTCLCCIGKGAVVVINQRFEQQEEGLLFRIMSLFCCCCKSDQQEKHTETRESVEQNVVLSFKRCAPEGDEEAAKKEAQELLEACDSNWEKKKASGVPLLPETFETIRREKLRRTAHKAHTVAATIRAMRSQTRPSLLRQATEVFFPSASATSAAPSPVAQMLPELITFINVLRDKGMNTLDQIRRVQCYLKERDYHFNADWVSDIIETLIDQPTTGSHFDALVPDLENRFELAAMASTRL